MINYLKMIVWQVKSPVAETYLIVSTLTLKTIGAQFSIQLFLSCFLSSSETDSAGLDSEILRTPSSKTAAVDSLASELSCNKRLLL